MFGRFKPFYPGGCLIAGLSISSNIRMSGSLQRPGEMIMHGGSFSHLTSREVDILILMLERGSGDIAFDRMLREKLNFATVYFSDDIPADVVTLNSRLFYTLNGQQRGPAILVQSEGDDLPPFALSIHTMEGLGLLGLAVGEMKTIEYANGSQATIAVDEVVFQPEAGLTRRHREKAILETVRDGVHERTTESSGARIMMFRAKDRPGLSSGGARDDDDPGPEAA